MDKSVGHHFSWIERLSGNVRLQIVFRVLTIIPSPGREGRRDTQILRRRGKKLEILRRVSTGTILSSAAVQFIESKTRIRSTTLLRFYERMVTM